MTTLGLDESLILNLARGVATPPDDDSSQPEWAADIFARASWTGIAEPGDAMAGHLIATFGAVTALEAVIEAWPVDQLLGRLAEHGDGGAISAKDVQSALDRWKPRLRADDAIAGLRQAVHFAARLMIPADPDWPQGVADLGVHGPIALWRRGSDEAFGSLSRSVALVGARAATGYGEHVAMEFSAGLCDRGFAVVSGAAYGIDGMAHRAALASGGVTVAFLAGGIDRFYPSGHDALLRRISQVGSVVSELPCGSSPTKWRFLQRNRLIAATSRATVVIEAGHRSGSLNTAAHAAAIGRPLGAVPGPITSPASAGCHRLFREFDAVCVTTVDEVVELAAPGLDDALAGGTGVGASGTGAGSSVGGEPGERASGTARRPPDQTRVLDALVQRSARSIAEVARRAGLSIDATEAVLGLLALEGAVTEVDAGWRKG